MCKLLKISRSLVYYKKAIKSHNSKLEDDIITIFKSSRNTYGTRKIKKKLVKLDYQVSRRRIGVNINILHTDRGNEFKNKAIDKLLNAFKIKRSLSKKGCPYDNAVAEATFKIIKTEFTFNRIFDSLEELQYELFDYVNWYNNHRIHGSQYRKLMSDKKVS